MQQPIRSAVNVGSGDNLVVSRRALLEEEAEAAAADTRARLEVGAVFPGKVTRIEKYGAFVDIGGIEGLLHVSEMAYGRVEAREIANPRGDRAERTGRRSGPAGEDR